MTDAIAPRPRGLATLLAVLAAVLLVVAAPAWAAVDESAAASGDSATTTDEKSTEGVGEPTSGGDGDAPNEPSDTEVEGAGSGDAGSDPSGGEAATDADEAASPPGDAPGTTGEPAEADTQPADAPARTSSATGSEAAPPSNAPESSIAARVRADTAVAARRARARAAAARQRAHARIRIRLIDAGVVAEPRGTRSAAADSDGAGEVTVATDPGRVSLLPGRRDILVRRRALVRGYIPIRRPGRTVILEVMRRDGSWAEVDRTRTVEDGKFYLAWYPSRPGHFRVRARPVNPASGRPSGARLLYIYRRAIASWYGPGFYGNRTACGQTFSSRLFGVAHKTLPCGKRVTVRYGRRSITVPVVDRGPYVRGRDYDLTEATRNHLGFDGVDEIWATA